MLFREIIAVYYENHKKTKLRGLSPQANYTDRATAAVSDYENHTEHINTLCGQNVEF
jgi:hypothetical protein